MGRSTQLWSRLRRCGPGLVLGAWFVGLLVLGAGLLARHLVALPVAEAQRVGPSLGAMRSPAEQGRWLAVHVLYAECYCSRRISDHLLASERPAGWAELVLWTGEGAPDPRLQAHGFRVERVSSEILAGAGIEAAPMLLALDPDNRVRYAGGYTERNQADAIQDRNILETARASSVAALPVWGCAVSERLRSALASLPVLPSF